MNLPGGTQVPLGAQAPGVLALAPSPDAVPAVRVWSHPRGEEDSIAHAYARHGHDVAHHIPGPFAFVIQDHRRGRVLIGRDPVGSRAAYFRLVGAEVECHFSLVPFAQARSAKVNQRWLACYLEQLPVPRHETAFSGVSEVMPGEMVVISSRSVQTRRWHAFDFSVDDSAPLADHAVKYREAVIRATGRPRSHVGVKVGIAAQDAAVLAAAVAGRPEYDPRLCGFGIANFVNYRDHILDLAVRLRLSRVELIMGWPGSGTTWAHWYRVGARALGFPPPHGVLLQVPLLEGCRALDVQSFLAAGRGEEIRQVDNREDPRWNWVRPGLHRGSALFSHAARLVPRRRRKPTWRPGPLISRAVAEDFGLYAAAETAAAARRRRFHETGNWALGQDGFGFRVVDRLTALVGIGNHFGVDVRLPLHDPAALRLLVATRPLPAGVLVRGHGLLSRAFPEAVDPDIDWVSRSRTGAEQSKTSAESDAARDGRMRFLRGGIRPALLGLLDQESLQRKLDRMAGKGAFESPQVSSLQYIHNATEFAHVEAANHWLEEWDLE